MADNFWERNDAVEWADEYIKARTKNPPVNEDDEKSWLVSWFANAFQAGEWNSPQYKKWAEEVITELRTAENG